MAAKAGGRLINSPSRVNFGLMVHSYNISRGKDACAPREANLLDGSEILNSARNEGTGIHSEYQPIAAPTHPQAGSALAFWDARPADGIIIGRDVPSRAIASMLSTIIVHEPINGGSNLKVRVAGTAIRRRFGRDVTGSTLSELFPTPAFPSRLKSVLTAIETNAPQFADCQFNNGSLGILHSELVILPIFAPDRVSKWGLSFVFFFN
jgi:hypothetical protein